MANQRQEVLEKQFLTTNQKLRQTSSQKMIPRTSKVHWSPDQTRLRQRSKKLCHQNVDPNDSLPSAPTIEASTFNGSKPNGSGSNGSGPNGSRPNGSGPNGSEPNGREPNGSGPNGSGPNGSGPNGSERLEIHHTLTYLPPITSSKAAVHSLTLPSFNAYRSVDNRLLANFQYEQKDDHDLKDLLRPMHIARKTAAITILETDVDGVVRIADDPDVAEVHLKYQRYRCRRESVEQTAKSNWMLMQENKDLQRKHEKQWRRLQVSYEVQIAQTHELLSKRLREIKGMCNTRCDAISILPSLTESQLQLVENLTEVNSLDFREERKAKRTLTERFRNAGRMALIMVHGFNDSRRRYHQMDAMSRQPIKGNSSDIFVEVEHEKRAAITPGIAPELHMAFITQPENRSHKDITQILWVIKSYKVFMDLFPDDMEYELARRVSYERYDEGRVVAYQNRQPDKFYFVISGKLSKLTEFQLNTGTVTRVVDYMGKNSYSDLEGLEKQWQRKHHLVAKGGVELLSLQAEDFSYITKADEGLPIEFLKTIDIFSEFPMDKFHEDPDSIFCKYYGRGQVVVADSNRTPYIHVIKSGRMKVIRRQNVLAIESCKSYINEARKRPHDPLYTKQSLATHADAMLGPQEQQRKTKLMLYKRNIGRSKSTSPRLEHGSERLGSRAKTYITPNFIQTPGVGRVSLKKKATPKLVQIKLDRADESSARRSERKRSVASYFNLPPLHSLRDIKNPEYPSNEQEEGSRSPHVLPIIINLPMRSIGEALQPIERTWVDPEIKSPELPRLVSTPLDSNKTLPQRDTVIQLDILKPKSVFGLDHLHEAKFSEGKGYTLLSDGVEVVSISKRFFQHHADNNTMLQVETMFRDYMDTKMARETLYTNANWDQYRHNLLKQTLTSVKRKNCL